MTRTVAHYERLEQIGEGTYGQVYRAVCRDTNQIVALKKMRIHHGGYWGMPLQLIREIKILKKLHHPSLLQMIEVVTSKGVEHLDDDDPVTTVSSNKHKDKVVDIREGYKGNLFLVLEYVSHDLTGLLDIAYQFTEVQVKCIFRQLLQALQYMHAHKYVHRDIKSSNILLNDSFELKLADFGLARSVEPTILDQMHDHQHHNRSNNNNNSSSSTQQDLTNKVITLWYRPPEILVGTVQYTAAVDVWSAGCILAELVLGKPLFAGKTEVDQLQMIVELLGTPSQDTWDYLSSLKKAKPSTNSSATSSSTTPDTTLLNLAAAGRRPSKLREKYSHKIPATTLNLLEKLLEWDPRKRLTAANALDNRYFWSQPVAPDNPADLGQVLPTGHFHEFQTKKKRRQAKAVAEQAREAAKLRGASGEEAMVEFDRVYRELMKKVAEEGFDSPPKKSAAAVITITNTIAADVAVATDTDTEKEPRMEQLKAVSSRPDGISKAKEPSHRDGGGRQPEGKKRKDARSAGSGDLSSRRAGGEDRGLARREEASIDRNNRDNRMRPEDRGREEPPRRDDRGVRGVESLRRDGHDREMRPVMPPRDDWEMRRDGPRGHTRGMHPPDDIRRDDRGTREGRRDEPRRDDRRSNDRNKGKRPRKDEDERKRARDVEDEEMRKRRRRDGEDTRDRRSHSSGRVEKEAGGSERPKEKDAHGEERKQGRRKSRERRRKKTKSGKDRGKDGDRDRGGKDGDRKRERNRDQDERDMDRDRDRFRDDRGPPRDDRGPPGDARGPMRADRGPKHDDRGPPRDDRGSMRDERGPPRDDRGPPGDDRGPPRDDHGPPRDDRGPPRDDRGPIRDDRGPMRDARGPPRGDRGPPRDDRGPMRDDRGPPPGPYGPGPYGPPPPQGHRDGPPADLGYYGRRPDNRGREPFRADRPSPYGHQQPRRGRGRGRS